MVNALTGPLKLPSRMATNMRDNFIMDFYTEKEFSFGPIISFTKETLLIIELQEKELINGLMEVPTKGK